MRITIASILFSKNLAVDFNFFALQDKHNVCVLSVKLKLLALVAGQTSQALQMLHFLPVSKARTNK